MKEHRYVAEVYDDLTTTMDWLDARREGLGSELLESIVLQARPLAWSTFPLSGEPLILLNNADPMDPEYQRDDIRE